jgi:hypothetical protein
MTPVMGWDAVNRRIALRPSRQVTPLTIMPAFAGTVLGTPQANRENPHVR